MKVFQINSFGNLSTGRIACDIYRTLKENGHDGIVAYSRGMIADDVPGYRIGNKWSVYVDGILTRLTDRAGFYSKDPTKKLIAKIKEYDPDIIHLHNLHGYYLNIGLLFNYLEESGKPVVWTLHDCWPFTGHCSHFDVVKCKKWQTGCFDCPQISSYPSSFVDNSRINFRRKKELFTQIDNMLLVTPSIWLKELVNHSFLYEYPIEVIRNGVDQSVFRPTYGRWIKENNLVGKKIVLSVAGTWSDRKGLPDLIRLSELLPSEFKLVIVGVDKKQKASLPKSILGIERTYNSKKLAEIYTSAFVFVNPTYEDNFPNVNIEALSCGTPIITYKTGGSPEAVATNTGIVVTQGNIIELRDSICSMDKNSKECLLFSKNFDKRKNYLFYNQVYKDMLRK